MLHSGADIPRVFCVFHDVRVFGSSNTSASVPGGSSGVLSKLNSPLRTAYAENLLLQQALRSKFRVNSACGKN